LEVSEHHDGAAANPSDVAQYCRQLETYLCQKNGGHLIRIVGPAFEQVRGWAVRGVPLKIALRGIDQYCERQRARAPRPRPVRIEFCEADILQLFDDWRRALGVTDAAAEEIRTPRKPGLAAHIEKVIARLIAVRGGESRPVVPTEEVDEIVRALDDLNARASGARGEARIAVLDRLNALDRRLMEAAVRNIDPAVAARLRDEAAEELAGFGQRIAPEARAAAIDAAFLRLVRETAKLPRVAYE
jgi:hypothetical protein